MGQFSKFKTKCNEIRHNYIFLEEQCAILNFVGNIFNVHVLVNGKYNALLDIDVWNIADIL